MQQRPVARLAGIPPRVPRYVAAKAKPDRIDFLTHLISSPTGDFRPLRLRCRLDLTDHDGEVRERLEDLANSSASARHMAFQDYRLADMGLGDDEIVDIEVVIVLGVGDRRLQALADIPGATLAGKFKIGKRHRNLFAANELRQQVQL